MGCSNNSPSNKWVQQVGGSVNFSGVYPGLCPPEGCPEPTEIVCIKVEKVYESCRKVETNTETTDLASKAVGEVIDAECKEVKLVIDADHPFLCEKIANTNRIRVSFFYQFKFRYEDQESVKTFTSEPILVQRTIFLDRADEPDLFAQCEVFLECTECFVSGFQEVTCCIGKLIVVKLVALVQLMVPAYGFCPEPDTCPQVLAECPEFIAPWPPYPEQRDNNG